MDNRIKEVCKNYSISTGIDLTIMDGGANLLYETGSCSKCGFCGEINKIKGTAGVCKMSHLYGSLQAQRFGGRYIFFCHMRLNHFSSLVILEDGKTLYITSSPFLMTDHEDYFEDDILKGVPNKNLDSIKALICEIPLISPERIHALSETLFRCVEPFSFNKVSNLTDKYENQKLQGIISDYIMKIKNNSKNGFYPLEKEDELLDAMASGDIKAAKGLLNQLLGYIFFYSGFKFDVIRSRVLELIVLLSRAAVKGGADAELIFGLNYEYLKEVDTFTTIEDLAYWLSGIMNRFTDYVFNFVGVKHVDIIYKATNYIKNNYMEKITLEDVANYVYLSPSYFSKVFKEDVKCNFNSYLNNIRIDQSKKFLLNENINLADISNMVGYEDQSYYSKVFKKVTGMSPLKFRQSRGK